MTKILKAISESVNNWGKGNAAGRRAKNIEYRYIYSPRGNGAGFNAVCAG